MKKQDLIDALEIVRPALATKEILEQSTHFAFLDGMVCAYNDEVSIRTSVKNLGLKLKGAIKADELYQLLSKIKNEEIEIDITENEIILKAGRAKAGMPLQQEIKLPVEEIAKDEDLNWISLPKEFKEALKFASFACSKDNSKPILTCVHVNNAKVEASDYYRITQYTMPKSAKATFLLPCSSAKTVLSYDVVQCAIAESWVHFKDEKGTKISCRIFEGKYPDVDKHFKVKGTTFTFPDRLPDVLDRACVFSTQGYAKGYALDATITVLIDKKQLIVKAKNEAGWFKEELRVAYDGDAFSFCINPDSLKEMSQQMKTCVLTENCLKFTGENWEHVIALREAEK